MSSSKILRRRDLGQPADKVVRSTPFVAFPTLVPGGSAATRQPEPEIEASSPPAPPQPVAAGLIERAEREAAEIVVRAAEEARLARESAAEVGRQEGYRDGRRIAEEEAGAAVRGIAALADGARIDRQALLRDAALQIADLSVAIARQLVERELATDRGVIVEIVRAALREVEDANAARIRVRVSPEQVPLLSARWSNEAAPVDFVADPDLGLGDCILDSQIVGLDARVETRLAEIGAGLRATVEVG